jgi:multidrug efflux pump subunit AcrB
MGSVGETSPDRALADQVEAILRESAALSAALAKARAVRRVLLLVVVVFVVVVSLVFWRLANTFFGDENKKTLLAAAQQRLEKNQEGYLKQVQTVVDRTHPKLTQAFFDQAKKDMPEYVRGFDKEKQQLASDLERELQPRLEKRYQEALKSHEKILKEEFPQATDQTHERMMENLGMAMQKLVKKYYIDELDSQTRTLFDAWETFPPADTPGKNEPSLEDQFLDTMIELLTYKLTHPETFTR